MKIEEGNMTIEDSQDKLIETEKGYTCGCGKPSISMTSHIDGTDFYSYQFVCGNCGNVISQTVKRDKDDMMYFDESEE